MDQESVSVQLTHAGHTYELTVEPAGEQQVRVDLVGCDRNGEQVTALEGDLPIHGLLSLGRLIFLAGAQLGLGEPPAGDVPSPRAGTPRRSMPVTQDGPVEMCVAAWTRHNEYERDGELVEYDNPSKRHITLNGERTRCGCPIPEHAELEPVAPDAWHLRTDCYNCAYRLWDQYGPAGYLRPQNGKDFPPRRSPATTPAASPRPPF